MEIPRPDVADEWLWIWRAWWRLHRDRPYFGGAMGPLTPGRISWRNVVDWCDFHDYPGATVDFLDTVLACMDTVFLEHYAEKAKQQKP